MEKTIFYFFLNSLSKTSIALDAIDVASITVLSNLLWLLMILYKKYDYIVTCLFRWRFELSCADYYLL